MIRIGVLSDTHGHIDEPLLDFFSECDEIWHAGDIGSSKVIDILSEKWKFRGVHGNIDDWEVRRMVPEFQEFTVENVPVLITHIGFHGNRFTQEARKRIDSSKPALFICGHSHILKIKFDKEYNLLELNPGAAGIYGFHQVRTAVRFSISGNRIENLEVWEKGRAS